MNKFIKEQLDKAKISLPPYNDDTTQLYIHVSNATYKPSDVEVGKWYMIYVEDYIINEPDTFTLSTNWNNGTKPDDNKLYAQVYTINGKMVKVNTKGINTGTDWFGWLPRKSFTIIEDMTMAVQNAK